LQVLEVYKLGAATLKSTLKESGLTADSAADVMVQVEEVSWWSQLMQMELCMCNTISGLLLY
jgi:hypothetical protein